MGLFNSKNRSGEQLRTLSEKEIQDKLYGTLRNSSSAVRDDFAFRSSELTQKTAVSVSKPEAVREVASPASSATIASPKPTQPSIFPNPAHTVEKTSTNAGKPFEVVNGSNRYQPDKDKSKSSHSFKKEFTTKPAGPSVLSQLSKAAAVVANAIFAGLRTLVGALIGVFLFIDFRKAKVRGLLAVSAGILLLGALFYGIHSLNIKRETAMKAPRKKVVAPVAPVQTVSSQEEDVESSEVSSTLSQVDEESSTRDEYSTAERQSIVEPVAKKPIAASKSSKGSQVIQVATFATEEDAQKLVEKIEVGGLSAFVKGLTRSTGKVYYCVFIGRFQTSSEAEKALEKFRRKDISKSFQDAFVRSLD